MATASEMAAAAAASAPTPTPHTTTADKDRAARAGPTASPAPEVPFKTYLFQDLYRSVLPDSSAGMTVLVVLMAVFVTFGLTSTLMFALYALAFAIGFVVATCLLSWLRMSKVYALLPRMPRFGIAAVLQAKLQTFKLDRRITGSTVIDEPIQEVIDLLFRDYIECWYSEISSDKQFVTDVRRSFQIVIIGISSKCKEMNWVNFFTVVVVDEFIKHLRLYQFVQHALREQAAKRDQPQFKTNSKEMIELAEKKFFEVEQTRRAICCDPEKEAVFVRDLAEALMYLVLDPSDFHSKATRYFIREIVMSGMLPSVALVSDPDYMNQTLSVVISDEYLSFPAIMDLIRTAQSVEELQVVLDNIDYEISSKVGTGEESSLRNKAEMKNLMLAKRECEARKLYLTGETSHLEAGSKMRILPMSFILQNPTALEYFLEHLNTHRMAHLVDFWLTVDGYRASTAARYEAVEEGDPDRKREVSGEVREQGLQIYFQYLADDADLRVPLRLGVSSRIHQRLLDEMPTPDIFNVAQARVFAMLVTKFYPSYLRSDPYFRCTYTLQVTDEDMAPFMKQDAKCLTQEQMEARQRSASVLSTASAASSGSHESDATVGSGQYGLDTSGLPLSGRWKATLGEAKRKDEGGKAFTVYEIHVEFMNTDTNEIERWTCARRYSEFDGLQSKLNNGFGNEIGGKLSLPPKRKFGNMNKEFLEKRYAALKSWLSVLMSDDIIEQFLGIKQLVATFLSRGAYKVSKSNVATKLAKNVANAAARAPAFQEHRRTPSEGAQSSGGRSTDSDREKEKDSIPFRILLSLMDEVFELQGNQWMRKRIMGVLRTFIKTALGDSINRKIVESIETATSSEQVAAYVTQLRDSWWPNGTLAPAGSARSEDCRIRTRCEAKGKLFGVLPDELKRIVGNGTAKRGSERIFDMFQHPRLNKRLVYAILEAFLTKLFPQNNFVDIFAQLHAASLKVARPKGDSKR